MTGDIENGNLDRQIHVNGLLRERIAQLEAQAEHDQYRADTEAEQRDTIDLLKAQVTELARNAEADQKHIDALRDERDSWIRKAEEASRNYEALQEERAYWSKRLKDERDNLKAERDRYVAENRKLWARVHAAQNVLAGQIGGGS